MTVRLDYTTFSKHENTPFVIPFSDAQITLNLVSVTDKSDDHCETFSLLFRSDSPIVLQQRIYSMTHEEMGDLQLFLVPIGKEQDQVLYESIFNRLRSFESTS